MVTPTERKFMEHLRSLGFEVRGVLGMIPMGFTAGMKTTQNGFGAVT